MNCFGLYEPPEKANSPAARHRDVSKCYLHPWFGYLGAFRWALHPCGKHSGKLYKGITPLLWAFV